MSIETEQTIQKTKQWNILAVLFALALFTSACSLFGGGEDPPPPPITATINEVSGSVQVTAAESGGTTDAVDGAGVAVNDRVFTNQNSRARVDISSGAVIRMSPLTTFTLTQMSNVENDPITRLKLEAGKLWIILNGGIVEVDTPAGQASVRGSYLHVWVNEFSGETFISCLEGFCSLGNNAGAIELVAGQTAKIVNSSTPPSTDRMSDEDVSEWLEINPEATLVIIPLTATSALLNRITPTLFLFSSSTPALTGTSVAQGTETETPEISGTITVTATATETAQATDAGCGPPVTWISYTPVEGDTVESLSVAFRTTTESIRTANCFSSDTSALLVGVPVFVPDVATSTPIPGSGTSTPTPTATAGSPQPTNTTTGSGTGPTSTPAVTMTPAAIGSGTNGTMVELNKPPSTLSTCANTYTVIAVDLNIVDNVIVEFSLNDDTFENPIQVDLVDTGNSEYSDKITIYTHKNLGKDIVYYRFVMEDKSGFRQSYTDEDPYYYQYNDSLDCGPPGSATATPVPNKPSSFTFLDGPADGSTISSCTNLYRVKVQDQEGVSEVYLVVSLNDSTFSSPDFHLMNKGSTTHVWRLSLLIDTSAITGDDIVYYKFKAVDSYGDVRYNSGRSFTDPLDCT